MSKLIVNADDLGYSPGVNYGIIHAHKAGIVSSATMMANMPGFEHAVELLKDTPTLRCGVHLTLTCHKPLTDNVATLVNEDGKFHRRFSKELVEQIDLDQLYKEFSAQIDKTKNSIDITHLDSHHHVHTIERFRPVIQMLVDKYKLPIRHNIGITGVDNVEFIGTFYDSRAKIEWFEENMSDIKSKGVVDIMTHPAFLDSFMYESTSYNLQRMNELSILTDEKVSEILCKHDIKLVNYVNYK